jgi:glycosyltransferase involved in cell wall biosynthesis
MGRLAVEMPKLLAEGRYDYSHFQYVLPFRCPSRTIVTIHDVLPFTHPQFFGTLSRYSRLALFRLAAHRADIVTTVSAYSADNLAREVGLNRDRIHVVPNGVDERFFRRLDPQSVAVRMRSRYGIEKYILYVSRFEERKNQLGLVRAFLEGGFGRRGFQLVLVGSTRQIPRQLIAVLDELDSAQRTDIKIIEDVPDSEMCDLLCGARLFVYPSLAEGFGIPPLEAAALGIPTICSKSTAMGEFTFFGSDQIDVEEPGRLAQAMACRLESPSHVGELSKRSEIIRKRYSWESAAVKFWEAVNEGRGAYAIG